MIAFIVKAESIGREIIIEVNLVTSITDQVLDIESYIHICSNLQALKDRRILCSSASELTQMLHQSLSGVLSFNCFIGLGMKIKNVCFVPSISINIIRIFVFGHGWSFIYH